jgi:hypothetical protein
LILIDIEGGTKTQKNIAEEAVRFYIKKLMPRKRSLIIDLKIRNLLKDDLAGLCERVDKNYFILETHHRGNLYEFLSYLAHEVIHLKQYATGELNTSGKKELWNGEDHTDTPYRKQPWEVEAWSNQHALAKDYIKNGLGLTLKATKELNPRSMKKMDWAAESKFLINLVDKQEARKCKKK